LQFFFSLLPSTQLLIHHLLPTTASKSAAPAAKGKPGKPADAAKTNNNRGGRRSNNAFEAEAAPDVKGPRSRGGASRSGGRGRDAARPGKREHDRHDASGRGHEVEKRHGTGKGNWGAQGEETNEDGVAKLTLEEEEANGAQEEEAEVQMSLEEYEAQQAEKRAALKAQRESVFKVDSAQFSGMKTFEKQEDDAGIVLTKNAKSVGTNKAGREKELKAKDVITNVGFRIASEAEQRPAREQRGGGRGGGRGGSRGGGGGGSGDRNRNRANGDSGRGSRGGQRSGGRGGAGGGAGGGGGGGGGGAAIKIDNTRDFPTLG